MAERLAMTPQRMLRASVWLLILVTVLRPVTDPDIWWHLATGRWIVTHGHLPGHDVFTFSAATHTWILHEWLFELAAYGLYTLGGLTAISLALGALAYAGFLILDRTLPSLPRHVAPLMLLGGALVAGPIVGPRVQMADFTLSAVELLILRRHRTHGGRAIWALPGVMLLWANFHGGFLIGLAWLVYFLLAEVLDARLGGDASRRRPATGRARTLALVLVASGVATLVTPFGPQSLIYPFATITSPAQRAFILEWHSPDFHMPQLWPLLAMLAGGSALLAAWRKPRALEVGLFVVGAAMSLSAVRYTPLFVVAALPGLSLAVADAFARLRGRRQTGTPVTPPLGLSVAGGAVVLLVALAVALRVAPPLSAAGEMDAVSQSLPVGVTNALARTSPPGRVVNQYEYGGYLIWALESGAYDRFDALHDRTQTFQVYIFGDAALMGDSLMRQYEQITYITPDWLGLLGAQHADYVVVAHDAPLRQALLATGDWKIAYQDQTATLLERRLRVMD